MKLNCKKCGTSFNFDVPDGLKKRGGKISDTQKVLVMLK